MKQIGARQEAGRIGGIGPCGRPLCCSLWMTNFVSVSTAAARHQDLSLNPQKLAGQCAKLKCCLNFEVDAYVEANKKMPERNVRLETTDATWFYFKSDIFRREITYSSDKNVAANLVTISADRAFEVIAMNRAGEKPDTLAPATDAKPKEKSVFGDVLGGEEDIARFDNKKKKKRKKKSGNGNGAQPQASAPKDKAQAAPRPKDESPRQEGSAEARPKRRKPKKKPASGGESHESHE